MVLPLIARAAAAAAKRYGMGAARETGKKSGGFLKGTEKQKEVQQLRNRSRDIGRAQGAAAAGTAAAAGASRSSKDDEVDAAIKSAKSAMKRARQEEAMDDLELRGVRGMMGGGKVKGYAKGGMVCRGGGAAERGTKFRGVK